MLGNPQWFRPKAFGWGLVPIRWQGWAYTAGWVSAIGLPFLLLAGRHQGVEAIAWLGLSVGTLLYDVRQILQTLRGYGAHSAAAAVGTKKPDDNVLYISDSCPDQAVATRNYNLLVRR